MEHGRATDSSGHATQGSQFTPFDWTDRLKRAKTKISLSCM